MIRPNVSLFTYTLHHHVFTKHAVSQSIPSRPAYIEYGTLKIPNPFREEHRGLPCDFDGFYFFPAPIVGGSPRRPWNAIRDIKTSVACHTVCDCFSWFSKPTNFPVKSLWKPGLFLLKPCKNPWKQKKPWQTQIKARANSCKKVAK